MNLNNKIAKLIFPTVQRFLDFQQKILQFFNLDTEDAYYYGITTSAIR